MKSSGLTFVEAVQRAADGATVTRESIGGGFVVSKGRFVAPGDVAELDAGRQPASVQEVALGVALFGPRALGGALIPEDLCASDWYVVTDTIDTTAEPNEVALAAA
jgi:hypothetical protein